MSNWEEDSLALGLSNLAMNKSLLYIALLNNHWIIANRLLSTMQALKKKTFDSIYHFTLWKIFKTCSIPETYIGIFQQLHTIPQCCFKTVSGTADYFKVEQDSSKMTLHHLFLFVIVDPLMRTPMSPTHCGII